MSRGLGDVYKRQIQPQSHSGSGTGQTFSRMQQKKDKKKTNTTGEYGVFGHTTTSLQLFAILYKIYMAQNENKCYSIWVKYIWKICRISGKQWYIIRQMCDFWR